MSRHLLMDPVPSRRRRAVGLCIFVCALTGAGYALTGQPSAVKTDVPAPQAPNSPWTQSPFDSAARAVPVSAVSHPAAQLAATEPVSLARVVDRLISSQRPADAFTAYQLLAECVKARRAESALSTRQDRNGRTRPAGP